MRARGSSVVVMISIFLVLMQIGLGCPASVRLQWNPSPTATSYTAYYGEDSKEYDIDLPVGQATSAIIADLTAGHTYYFAVTATNGAGPSEFSDEVSYTVPATPSDTIKPHVSITAPVNNAQVSRNTNITIKANASDNVGVDRVEFRVNGSLQCTDGSASYMCSWHVPSGKNKTYTLQARGYDAAGNRGDSPVVTVTSK